MPRPLAVGVPDHSLPQLEESRLEVPRVHPIAPQLVELAQSPIDVGKRDGVCSIAGANDIQGSQVSLIDRNRRVGLPARHRRPSVDSIATPEAPSLSACRVIAGLRYLCLDPTGAVHLVANPGTGEEQRIAFCRVLEIDRDDGREAMPGLLFVQDPLVSRRHCVLTRSLDGRCYVRDVSLNGTQPSGRQLEPNVEIEIRPGEVLTIAGSHPFVLERASASG